MNTAKKIVFLFLIALVAASCSRKRAPSKGCDCPGGHGMIEKASPQDIATIEKSIKFHS